MKCISICKTSRHEENEEYKFKPLSMADIVNHHTSEMADAINALVDENERLKEEINSLEALVLNQQSIVNHLISRIEALEKVLVTR